MDRVAYMAMKDVLSFEKPLWITLAVLAADLLLFLFGFWLIEQKSFFAFLLSPFIFALFFFHNFAILHECGHGSVHRLRWVNDLIGHYASIFCFLPYYPWKYIHQEHHVWSGNLDRDPTMKNLKQIAEQQKVPLAVRIAWRSWIPLAGLWQHFVFWFYPAAMWRSGKMTPEAFRRSCFSVLWLVVVYIALFALLPHWFNMGNFGLALLIYLIGVELVNLPHHSDMPSFRDGKPITKLHPWEQHLSTRTCYYPFGLSELLTLNFNLHTEHHFFPHLPWYRLKQVRRMLKPALEGRYNEVIGIRWNLANRRRDPNDIMLKQTPPEYFLQQT